MTDYIKRTDAVKIAEKYGLANGSALGRHTGLADCIASEILSLPAADVAPVVHGKWGDNGIAGSMLVKCSVCGFDCGANSFSYCPNCGARMRQAKREAEKLICENRERLVTPSCEEEQ